MKEILLNTKDVMELLSVSRTTVNRLAKKGVITQIKIGNLVRYNSKEIEKLMRGGTI